MTVTQYKGPRMVPLVPEPGQREWDKTKSYEYWTLVQHEGTSYISVQNVPAGIDITNENFWLMSAEYNSQIEAYRREVLTFDDKIKANADAVVAEAERAKGAEKVNADAISNLIQTKNDFFNDYGAGFKSYGTTAFSNIPGTTYPNGFDYKDGVYYVGFDNGGVGTINKYTMNEKGEFIYVSSCTLGDSDLSHCNSITHYGDYLFIGGGSLSGTPNKVGVVKISSFTYIGVVELPNGNPVSSCIAFTAPWAQDVPTLVVFTGDGHALRYYTLKDDYLTLDVTQPVLQRKIGFSNSYSQDMAYYYNRIFVLYSYNASAGAPTTAASFIAIYDLGADSDTPVIVPIDTSLIKPKAELEGIAIVNHDIVFTDVAGNAYVINGGAHIGENTHKNFNYNYALDCVYGGEPEYTTNSDGSFNTITLSKYAKELKNRNVYVELEFKFAVVGHHAATIKFPLYSDCVYSRVFDVSGGLLIVSFLVNYSSDTGIVKITSNAKDKDGNPVSGATFNCESLHINIPGYRYGLRYTL